MIKKNSTNKPLLFTTTLRNPERLKDFLSILFQYNKNILNNAVIEKIVKELIQKGLYRPTNVSLEVKESWKQAVELSDIDTNRVFNDNPQHHKEAGFDRGWASRFDTWFKIAKELGFVFYQQNQPIRFSESGIMLLDKDNPQNEQLVFVNSFAKYQRNNPFRRILNANAPLILLLETIQYLNDDSQFNGVGISKKEIPLLLCWQNNDAKQLYLTIKNLRQEYGYTPSDEVIFSHCKMLLDATKRDSKSILVDYPDDFIRKMRLTGLISLRGGGRFIDINQKEILAINYILNNYIHLKEFDNEELFFDYISKIDKKLIELLTIFKAPIKTSKKELEKWVAYYDWETLKRELLNLAYNKLSKDDILKVIERPLRLEFLTTLAILHKLPNVVVKPNFISDDEGLPVSFAQGGNPDIECLEDNMTILVEVTLLTGTQQHIRESFSVQRHLEATIKQGCQSFSILISPKAFIDTCRNAIFVKHYYGLEIKILDIDLFISQLESCHTLYNVAYTKDSCK